MSVFKEGFDAIEKIERKSQQLFQDACDFGAPTKMGDQIWNCIRALNNFTVHGTRTEHRYSTGATVSQTIALHDEWNDSYDRHEYTVSYVKCDRLIVDGMKYDGFVSVTKNF